jgi:15-cis-phytoene synthase
MILTSEEHKVCKAICQKFAVNYYQAVRRFPAELRAEVYALYSFVRIPDELVDNPLPGTIPAAELEKWEAAWWSDLRRGFSDDLVRNAFLKVYMKYQFDPMWIKAFFRAMHSDTERTQFQTYAELKEYMYGSAVVVGNMMSSIMGVDTGTKGRGSQALSEAFQLTNFLRDVAEDADRGRVYFPLDELSSFGVKVDDVLAKRFTKEWSAFVRHEIVRERELYKEASPAIAQLPAYARHPVTLAKRYYEAVLDTIERCDGDVFTNRARVSPIRKALITIRGVR